MQHMGQNTEDSCCFQTVVATALSRSLRHNDAIDAAFATAMPLRRQLRVGDTFQDRRQPGHQNAAPGGAAADQQPPQSSRGSAPK